MMIPDSTPRTLTERARLLRAVNACRKMLRLLRTKGVSKSDCEERAEVDRVTRGAEDGLIQSLVVAVHRGEELLEQLDRTPPMLFRPSRGVSAYLDLVFLMQHDFFSRLADGDQPFPV